METKPDTITITASQREEIQATHADLFVTVKGTSLASGDAALKKAKEVNQLVEELVKFGLPAEAIHLQSVYAEAASGVFLRTSSATYRLRIRCDKLEQFTDLLGIITSQKNVTFERVEWKYADEEARAGALEKAIGKAQAKAAKIAAGLGVRLLGIFTLEEQFSDREAPPFHGMMPPSPQSKAMRSTGFAAPDLGMDIQHSKTIEAHIHIEYRVSGFGDG